MTCNGCRHFYITWDKERPYGCHAFGFKAPAIPARIVYAESGMECSLYAARDDNKTRGKAEKGSDNISA